MADSSKKRKAESGDRSGRAKKPATDKKRWQTPRKIENKDQYRRTSIESGDAGIFATCDMGRERKCATELQDIFEEYADRLYDAKAENGVTSDDEAEATDVAANIANEIDAIRAAKRNSFFTNVRLEGECVVFFKTRAPVDPVSLVHAICKDASAARAKESRFVRKLMPMTSFGKATKEGLDQVARRVLGPHFHSDAAKGKKFAIRPNFRYHTVMTRMDVIQQTASVVGPDHRVDLKNYDLLILVEVYKNVLGMSVVSSDYDDLKRYNIAELHQPTPKADAT